MKIRTKEIKTFPLTEIKSKITTIIITQIHFHKITFVVVVVVVHCRTVELDKITMTLDCVEKRNAFKHLNIAMITINNNFGGPKILKRKQTEGKTQ